MTVQARDFGRRCAGRLMANAVVCVFLAASGCVSSPYRAHPHFRTAAAHIQAPLVLLPSVRVYDFTAQGRWEFRTDWSEQVNKNLLLALQSSLEKRNYAVRSVSSGNGLGGADIDEIRSLYQAVNKSIRLHTFGPQIFPHKLDRFEYSLGDLKNILRSGSEDSLILMDGFHQILRGSRRTGLRMAVADSSGTILWYCMKVMEESHDLRDPKEASRVIETLVASFSREQA